MTTGHILTRGGLGRLGCDDAALPADELMETVRSSTIDRLLLQPAKVRAFQMLYSAEARGDPAA